MDIELRLREILPLENPGPRFTDGVMSRLGDAPVGGASDSVVRLSDARARRISRGILLGTVLVVAAAASIPAYYLSRQADAPGVTEAMSSPPGEATEADPAAQALVEAELSGTGENPRQCVDQDVLRALLVGPRQTLQIGDALPPELAAFKAPPQLAWIGAAERGSVMSMNGAPVNLSSVAAVYRSGLAPDAARVAALGGLAAGGWKLHSVSTPLPTNVFTSANSAPAGETHCREGKAVTLSASALDGVTYVVLSVNRSGTAGFMDTCNQPPRAPNRASALDKYMPRLEPPRDPASGQPVSMLDGGGSYGEVKRSSNASFTLKDTADTVARHFARQMAEQGWSADTSWSGPRTAGSTWSKRGEADSILLANIAVSAFDDDRFTAIFNVVTAK
jgi:hypothetical protein